MIHTVTYILIWKTAYSEGLLFVQMLASKTCNCVFARWQSSFIFIFRHDRENPPIVLRFSGKYWNPQVQDDLLFSFTHKDHHHRHRQRIYYLYSFHLYSIRTISATVRNVFTLIFSYITYKKHSCNRKKYTLPLLFYIFLYNKHSYSCKTYIVSFHLFLYKAFP